MKMGFRKFSKKKQTALLSTHPLECAHVFVRPPLSIWLAGYLDAILHLSGIALPVVWVIEILN